MLYKPVWAYIPLKQYHSPGFPVRAAVRKEMVSFWHRLHPVAHLQRYKQKSMRTIPPYLLDRAVPEANTLQSVCPLETALQQWQQSQNTQNGVQIIVAPPGSGAENAVVVLSKQQGWQTIGPPSAEQILKGGDAWLARLQEDGLVPLVIPALGKCYLRHQEGLLLMSRLLDWLQTTRRRVLIACDSWAWTYLVQTLQINVMLPEPWVQAPFDGPRLQFWLPSLSRRIHKGRFVFRNVADGQLTFPMADRYEHDMNHLSEQEELYGEWVAASYFVRQLAAYSRGLPEVAWRVWRHVLQVHQDVVLTKTAVLADASDDRFTLWVPSWSQVQLPIVPSPLGTDECFVLHTLLLHGGMTAELLADLLPLSYNQVRRILHFFAESELLTKQQESWRVALLAYPAVRQFLAQEGYLVDDF